MLHDFLADNRTELISRCAAKVSDRASPELTAVELNYGIPIFLDQLIKTLRIEEMGAMEQTGESSESRQVSGDSGGNPSASEIGVTATKHGRELLEHGYTVDQVVHDYGDLCQAVTALALEKNVPIDVDEFRTFNRCLDNGIADAVSEFSYLNDLAVTGQEAGTLNEQLGAFAHELRNLVTTATLAVAAIKAGNVGLTGATGAVLDHSLVGLRNLIDRSLIEVRNAAGSPAQHRLLSLARFINEVRGAAALGAQVHGCTLTVSEVDRRLAVDADPDLLASAVGNLLQNAFKFTHPHTEVRLSAYASADRILIDVEDHCGGLPPGFAEKMFEPFTQGSEDRSGLGLGLSIARSSVEANGGLLSVRDKPGAGCVFTIDLPRHALPEA